MPLVSHHLVCVRVAVSVLGAGSAVLGGKRSLQVSFFSGVQLWLHCGVTLRVGILLADHFDFRQIWLGKSKQGILKLSNPPSLRPA